MSDFRRKQRTNIMVGVEKSLIFVEVLEEEARSCDARHASSEDARTFFRRALSRSLSKIIFPRRAAHADRPEKHKK